MKKVLITIFTDGRLPQSVYRSVISQDYPECSVLISVRKADKEKDKVENQVEHHNYIRKLCKESDADYFFFVDSDLVIPKNAVTNLMRQLEQGEYKPENFKGLIESYAKQNKISYDEAVKQTTPKKKYIMGGWYLLSNKPKLWSPSRWIADNAICSLKNIENSVVRVDKIASGCLMMSREVMEKITWRLDPNLEINYVEIDGEKMHSHPCRCVTFGIDAQDAGYDLWMSGDVVGKHLSVPHNWFEELIFWLKRKVRYQC